MDSGVATRPIEDCDAYRERLSGFVFRSGLVRDARFRTYWSEYHRVMGRKGVSPDEAKNVVRSRGTAVAALALIRCARTVAESASNSMPESRRRRTVSVEKAPELIRPARVAELA